MPKTSGSVVEANLSTTAVERALCGLFLSTPEVFDKVKIAVQAEDFSDPKFRMIYEVCLKLEASTGSPNWTWHIVCDALKSVENRPRELEYPVSFISSIVLSAPKPENLDVYLSQLVDKKRRIRLESNANRFLTSLSDPTKTPQDLYTEIRSFEDLFFGWKIGKVRVSNPGNLWPLVKEDIEMMATLPFIGTGYPSIDKHLAWGFAPGQISLIGGRPSEGKSSFRSNVMRNLARNGIGTLTISREQSITQEYFRLIALETGTRLLDIVRVKEWTEDELFAKVKKAFREYSTPKKFPHRFVEPSSTFFLKDVYREVQRSRNDGEEPQIVFVDLFDQLDDIVQARPSDKAYVIEQKLNESREMAHDLWVHFCHVVQLKRTGSEKGKIDVSELWRGSGGYEQLAHLAFQVERPGKLRKDLEDNHMIVSIVKQKDGPCISIEMGWDKECLKVFEKDSDTPDDTFASPFDTGATPF